MIEHFHFIRPDYLWLIPLFMLGSVLLKYVKNTRNQNDEVCDERLVPFVALDARGGQLFGNLTQNRWSARWMALGIITSILSLAGPSWKMVPVPLVIEKKPLVIALDISKSMDARDILPSRLDRAKHKINDVLDKYTGNQVGLVVFSRYAFVVVPITYDINTIKQMLQGIDSQLLSHTGVNVHRALEKSSSLLSRIDESKGHILLLTDGLTAKGYNKSVGLKIKHHVSVIDFSKEDTPLIDRDGEFLRNANGGLIIDKKDDFYLKKIATQFNGVYTSVSMDDTDIDKVLSMHHFDKSDIQLSSQFYDVYQDEGPKLLWVALLFMLISLILSTQNLRRMNKNFDKKYDLSIRNLKGI